MIASLNWAVLDKYEKDLVMKIEHLISRNTTYIFHVSRDIKIQSINIFILYLYLNILYSVY